MLHTPCNLSKVDIQILMVIEIQYDQAFFSNKGEPVLLKGMYIHSIPCNKSSLSNTEMNIKSNGDICLDWDMIVNPGMIA